VKSPMDLKSADAALIRRTVAAGCNDDEFRLFMHLCRAVRLDPLRGQCHAFVFGKDAKDQSKRRLTLVTSIAGLRTIADRTGHYRPSENEPEYHYLPWVLERGAAFAAAKRLRTLKRRQSAFQEIEEAFPGDPLNPHGIERVVTYVWKYAKGGWHRSAGEAWWDEYVPLREQRDGEEPGASNMPCRRGFIAPGKSGWIKMPRLMIAKCSEAMALRKGWPDDFSAVYEEAETDKEGARLDAVEEVRIANEQAALARQQRSGREILIDFGPGSQIEPVAIGQFTDRCMAFIEANKADPKLLLDWYGRNRHGFREFHAKQKGEAVAIARRLDDIASSAQERLEADAAHGREIAA
jgi:phage recombination protein Bet